MAFVYFLLALILFFYIKNEEKTLMVPSTVIVVTWCIFPGLNSLQPLHLYELSFYTHFIILLSLFTFLFAYYGLRIASPSLKTTNISPLSFEKDNNINYKLLIILNVIIAIWIFPKTIESWISIQIIGWDGLRTESEEKFGSTAMNLIYGFFAKPLVIASLALFAAEAFKNAKYSFVRILFILLLMVNILQETIIFAARATLVKVVIYILFAFFFLGKDTLKKSNKSKRIFKLALILFVVFQVLSIVTAGRNENNDKSLTDTFLIYYIAPFSVLNYYVENPDYSLLNIGDLTYGTCILGFIYNIFCYAVALFYGVPYKGTDNIINQVAGENVFVSPTLSMNAACTANYCFLKDFGIFGVFVGFSIMAFLILKIRKKYIKAPSVRNRALYIYMLYVVFRLSVFYDFLSPSAFFALFYIWLGTAKMSRIISLVPQKTKLLAHTR